MARKVFVSYKHSDDSVKPINGSTTVRGYVDELIELFEEDEVYKGEGDEDLSEFKDETIETHLKDKIYDSSITIVLISPKMKDASTLESDQWIPWEVAYSLKEITRNDRTSHTNGFLAVTLPDLNSSYNYYIVDDSCPQCHCRTLNTPDLFRILRKNMFNAKEPKYSDCPNHSPNSVQTGYSSYIFSVKWDDFINDTDRCLSISEEIRSNIDDYNITKLVTD